MLGEVKRKIRRWKWSREDKRSGPRIPERSQPGGPGRAGEKDAVSPPKDYAVPTSPKEKQHDGWGEIRPRRPGEDTDLALPRAPDITMPGKDLLPSKGDRKRDRAEESDAEKDR